jgi:predicted DNA-binding transcriptional regulator AlpA
MNTAKYLKDFQNLTDEVREVKNLQSKTLQILESLKNSSINSFNSDDEYISAKETCLILKCSEVTLWKLRRDNLIPYSRLNRTIRFKKSDVYNYLNQTN